LLRQRRDLAREELLAGIDDILASGPGVIVATSVT